MEEKNLESLRQSFLDIFSSYISLEKQSGRIHKRNLKQRETGLLEKA